MDEEQEEKNQSESFAKQSTRKLKAKGKDEAKKRAKQKIMQVIAKNPKVFAVICIVILIAVALIVAFAGFVYVVSKLTEEETSNSKKQSIITSYATETNIEDNKNKITIKPTNNNKSYEISNNYTDEEIKDIKNRITRETSQSLADFTDFEVAILGAMINNGLNLDDYTVEELHCFPYFIKAEACTQYLDLRKNSQKMKGNTYVPLQLKDLKESEVPGVILVQRTNTKDNHSEILEYKVKSEFDKLVESDNKDAIKYFTVNDKGNLIIAKWKYTKITVNGKYPDNIDGAEKQQSEDTYTITTEEFAYSQLISNYTMPFDFLVQLLVITEDPKFCKEVADIVLGSKIIINIEEEETFTEMDQINDYTIHVADEKNIDYNLTVAEEIVTSKDNHFLNYTKDDEENERTNYETSTTQVKIHTEITNHTYGFDISEADTWLIHYIKTFQKQNSTTDVSGPTTTDIKGNYHELEKRPDITDRSEINKDKDVKTFISNNKSNYEEQIPDPINITVTSGTDENGNNYKQIHYINSGTIKEIHGLTNGATIYYEVKDSDGKGTGEYELPGSIALEMKEVPATENTAKIPPITYIYILSGDKYVVQNSGDGNAEIVVTRLNIRDFEKIDLTTTTTTITTTYPADPNPISNVHIYATKSGKPGNGHGYKEFEKFLIAYDNNKNTRDMMNSVSDWLFEMMEENDNTTKLVEYIKWILYLYDGTNYGVTEEPDTSIFESEKFTPSTSTSSLDQFVRYLHSWEGGGKKTKNAKGEECYTVQSDGSKNGSAVGYGVDIATHGAKLRALGYDTSIGSLIPVEVVDAIEKEEIEGKMNSVRKNTAGLNLTEYQIYALVSRAYNCGVHGALGVKRGNPSLNFSDSYKKYWNQKNDDKYNGTTDFSHKLYTQYMSMPVTSGGDYLKGLENRRKSEWSLFQTGYFGYDIKNGSGHGIDEYYVEGYGTEFLEVAKNCHDYIRQNNFYYVQGNEIPYPNGTSYTDCSAYVTWVLYEYGYTELKGHQKGTSWFMNTNTMQKMGWTVKPATQAEAGDIVVNNHHMEIYAGDGKFYNAGSTSAIRKEISNSGKSYLNTFTYAITVTPPK